MFDKHDTNHTGDMDCTELESLLTELNLRLNDELYARYVSSYWDKADDDVRYACDACAAYLGFAFGSSHVCTLLLAVAPLTLTSSCCCTKRLSLQLSSLAGMYTLHVCVLHCGLPPLIVRRRITLPAS